MNSLELTKPVTTESLLSEFESRFNQTLNLAKFTQEELEDTANHIRTKIHEITQNTHFGQELKDNGYQKNQMMLDIVNQEIKEREQTNEILPAVGAALGGAARMAGGALAKGMKPSDMQKYKVGDKGVIKSMKMKEVRDFVDTYNKHFLTNWAAEELLER